MDFRKLTCVTVLTVLLGAANWANAADVQWFGANSAASTVHTRNWFDPNNWLNGGLFPAGPIPTSADNAKINFVWNNEGPIISSPGAAVTELKVSEDQDATTIGNQTLTVTTGGTLTTTGQTILGYYGADPRTGLPGNNGTFIMNGGLANLGSHLYVGFQGTGHLKVNGGNLNVGAQFAVFSNGIGTFDLNGGVVQSEEYTFDAVGSTASMNITGGTWLQNHYWQPQIQALVDNGTIKAYGGNGTVNVGWDPITQRTVVSALSIWDPCMIAVTNASAQILPIMNMFERGLTLDNTDTIFADAPAGTVSFVEWNNATPVRVNTFDVHLQSDSDGTNRATSHFTLKAKSIGSSTYDLTLYDVNVASPYPSPNYIRDIVVTLPTPVVAQYFRAEFKSATATGPRIREINATGTVASHLWQYEKVQVMGNSPVDGNPVFALKNMFEGVTDASQTLFQSQPRNTVYYVNWKMPSAEKVLTLKVKAERDGASPFWRALRHFTLKANSVDGSGTFDRIIYDTNVDANDPNWAAGKLITFTKSVVGREFRAEFTGNDPNGPRVWELDAVGFDNGSVLGDLNGSYAVDFKDFSILAANLNVVPTQQVVQNFEVSSLPVTTPANSVPAAGTWAVGCGHMNYPDTLFSPLPAISLLTSGAPSGSKAMQWNYNTADSLASTDYTYNSVTYALTAPVNLASFRQLTAWVKRNSTNVAESRFDVRFLRNGAIMDYSNAIAGSTADANGLWTKMSFPMNALNTDGRTIDMLTGIDAVQFFVDKGATITGHAGIIYIDDVAFTPVMTGDLNGDGKVDFLDMLIFSQNWLSGK